MQMRQRDVAALDAKYTKELADAKAENDALRDDVAAGRRRFCTSSKQSVSQCVKPPPPAWIMHSLPDWQTPLNGIISPSRERLITMQKQLEEASILMSSADRVCPYRWATRTVCEQYTAFGFPVPKCLK